MLGTAKTDTFSTELLSLLSVSGSISVCSYLKNSVLVSPSHDSAEFACDLSVNSSDSTVIDVTCCTVDRDHIAFNECLAAKFKLLVSFIHVDCRATGNAALTHTTSNNGCV